MFLVGIVTNQKNELYVKKELSDIICKENIIFINDKNISNMKNIKFEFIVIDTQINNIAEFRKIISNSKYVILNSDIENNIAVIRDLNLMILTYGFNNKSTFTVSSITESNIIICLQRIIFDINKEQIEPNEYKLKNDISTDIYAVIFVEIVKIIYNKYNKKTNL